MAPIADDTACCPLCHCPALNRHTRGSLTTQLDPPMAWWRGQRLWRPAGNGRRGARYPLRILHLLNRRGSAPIADVEIVGGGPDVERETIRGQITVLRNMLPPEVKVRNVFGWGYELIITEGE